MINCINDHQLTATVVRIEWERIIVSIDVKLSFASGVDKSEPLQFYACFAPRHCLKQSKSPTTTTGYL